MVNLLFSWGFIEILRYKQTARIKPLTENGACTFDTAHHGSDQSKPHSIGFLKEKFGVHTLSLPSISMVLLLTISFKLLASYNKCLPSLLAFTYSYALHLQSYRNHVKKISGNFKNSARVGKILKW